MLRERVFVPYDLPSRRGQSDDKQLIQGATVKHETPVISSIRSGNRLRETKASAASYATQRLPPGAVECEVSSNCNLS